MEILKNFEGSSLTIKLVGRLDTNTAPQLDAEVRAIEADITSLVLDLADVDYVSSAGLRVLLVMQKLMAAKGEFALINVNESVMEVFEITGFNEILTIK